MIYGQAITDFCERAVRMGQLIGGGEAWDLANGTLSLPYKLELTNPALGAMTSVARYKPKAPPIIPSIG